MLRQMCFKNFVHFKDHQSLTFKSGINILVGQNSSGKTSILELIRRCMTRRINNHVTSSYDENKEAYLVCEFDISNFYGEILHICNEEPVIQQLDLSPDPESLLSVVQKSSEGDIMFWKKTVCFRRNKKITVVVVRYQVKEDNIKHDKEYTPEYFVGEVDGLWMLKDRNEWKEEKFVVEDLMKFDLKGKTSNWKPLKTNVCENILEAVEKRYVSTTAMRSINPIQWSRSQHKSSHESESCKEAVAKAEILQTLLDNNEEVDCLQAEQLFTKMICPLKYKFNKGENNDITIEHRNEDPPEVKIVPLLKTPEGIIEAQQLALLLAHKQFKTLCFEEPDRGMHPKMIEQLLRILLEERNKTIIIVTHSPYFINTTTAKLTHVCVRRKDLAYSKSVHSVHSLATTEKVHKITDTDELKKILFSSRILCVEGKTDKIFIEAIFEYIASFAPSYLSEDVVHYIMGHQIIILSSDTFNQVTRDFCQQLNVKCTVLLDRDAILKRDVKKKTSSNSSASIDAKIKEIRLTGISDTQDFNEWVGKSIKEFLSNQERFLNLSEHLEKKNIFIWKYGDLEETIKSVVSSEKELFQKLFGNEVKKTTICTFDKDQLKELAQKMCKSSEIERLLKFLDRLYRQDTHTAGTTPSHCTEPK